jgi:DUF917 family protein
VQRIGDGFGPWFYEVWNTTETPARIDKASSEPKEEGIILAPPAGGTRIRVLDVPPEGDEIKNMSAEEAVKHFAEIGAQEAPVDQGQSERHALMHRTETIDYGIVLEGEIVLIMDEGEMVCRQGDIIIQRGTNHGWSNRSDKTCRIAFILIDGKFEDGLG